MSVGEDEVTGGVELQDCILRGGGVSILDLRKKVKFCWQLGIETERQTDDDENLQELFVKTRWRYDL